MSLWGTPRGDGRLGPAPREAAHLEGVARLKEWTRARFCLTQDDVVLVTEGVPTLPGYPAVETVVAFWSADEPHHFKVFKPAGDVLEADLPPPWMKEALAGAPGIACACC